MSHRDPANLAARNLIAARLTERHGLDPLDAHTAVSSLYYGLPTEHQQLIQQETDAVLRERASELQARIVEAFAPLVTAFQALGEATARAREQHQALFARSPRPRPAWQSPYGPPWKGHRS
ncbi:hypothetical protein [Streptomyces sp. NPDC058674]|uniref:hypothetical protein n=1 Tax=Streptomyces sp. NPDC058674 TaxID=3346592 RepID=UPI00364FB134